MSSKGRIKDRQPDDYYSTPAWATRAILPHLNLTGRIFEPAAGKGAIVTELLRAGVSPDNLYANELNPDRAKICEEAAEVETERGDFLTFDFGWRGHAKLIITNPPYLLAQEFILRAKEFADPNHGEVAMLLRVNFLSGLERQTFWRTHPAHVFVLPKQPSFCVIQRDVFQCQHCKRKWKVPHSEGPFAVPSEDQCECGEIPIFKKTVKTANDSCEYGWFVWGPKRERRWDVLELPVEQTTSKRNARDRQPLELGV